MRRSLAPFPGAPGSSQAQNTLEGKPWDIWVYFRIVEHSFFVILILRFIGEGGTLTINNVQGNGAGQWVSLYYANGDSTYRNTTVRCDKSIDRVAERLR